ncbi:hypothetical protein B0H11DRAFT_1922230 [Mycena galericulata]|nr:hypothetical protein B0H11DRAFT_1922230 [Mycena galericulata]
MAEGKDTVIGAKATSMGGPAASLDAVRALNPPLVQTGRGCGLLNAVVNDTWTLSACATRVPAPTGAQIDSPTPQCAVPRNLPNKAPLLLSVVTNRTRSRYTEWIRNMVGARNPSSARTLSSRRCILSSLPGPLPSTRSKGRVTPQRRRVSSIYAVLPSYPRLADAVHAEWGGEAGEGCILIAARVEKPTFSAHPLPVSKLPRRLQNSNGISVFGSICALVASKTELSTRRGFEVGRLVCTATILASREGILHQKLEFFGGCKAVHPPYTTARIFLTRSLAHPLVSRTGKCQRHRRIWQGNSIPIHGGSHLLALATTGVREVFAPVSSRSSNLVGLVLGRNTRKVVVTEFNVVQPDPRLSNTGLNSATLFIIPAAFGVDPVILSQDYTDTSVQDGFASLGGFWSFVNGVFVTFFGANIMYFLFGTRPLSALGLVHVIQRSSLIKNWYQDFPALRTEGGQPGTENAGIVAFIRQRLVDVGPDEEVESDQRTIDLEAQDSTGGAPYEEIPQIEEGVELERIQVEAIEVDGNSAQVSTVGTAIAEVEK